ncbi:MAG TPA: hypothetical protein DEF45_04040 [Rhodopirellula sp.]|nr:hypothetical protein [Rhodopirellula sp.]
MLAECTFEYAKDADVRVAVIPLGATKPHNLHLPYGTDVYEATVIGERICQQAFQQGATVTLLSAVPFGVQTNTRKLPLAINVNPAITVGYGRTCQPADRFLLAAVGVPLLLFGYHWCNTKGFGQFQ